MIREDASQEKIKRWNRKYDLMTHVSIMFMFREGWKNKSTGDRSFQDQHILYWSTREAMTTPHHPIFTDPAVL